MGERRSGRLPEPSQVLDRAAEAAGDAGDLASAVVSSTVGVATEVIARFTGPGEEPPAVVRRRAGNPTGNTAKGVGATVKRAAKATAENHRIVSRAKASAGKKVANEARKAGHRVTKAASGSSKSRKKG